MVGTPIYKLDRIDMGCFPPELSLWQKTSIEIRSGICVIITIILMICTIKRSRSVQFFIFYRLKLNYILCYRNQVHLKCNGILIISKA